MEWAHGCLDFGFETLTVGQRVPGLMTARNLDYSAHGSRDDESTFESLMHYFFETQLAFDFKFGMIIRLAIVFYLCVVLK